PRATPTPSPTRFRGLPVLASESQLMTETHASSPSSPRDETSLQAPHASGSIDEVLRHLWPVEYSEAATFYARNLPQAYRHTTSAARIATDLMRVERLDAGGVDAYLSPADSGGECRLAVLVATTPMSLSKMLPILHSLGVEVVDQFPHRIMRRDGMVTWLYDFGVVSPAMSNAAAGARQGEPGFDDVAARVRDTVLAVWAGDAEPDGFNALVLRAGLSWQQANVLRVYARYLQQVSFPHGLTRVASVLGEYPAAARTFVELFAARFDPATHAAEAERLHIATLRTMVEAAVTLEADRVIRALLDLMIATVRTNYYRPLTERSPRSSAFAIKISCSQLDFVAEPRPMYEVFVSSPLVEGVHLRFGRVARGGLRWSDRADDFRTEILGLVKAQAVKNAVIVPVGAKGGFVVRRPPEQTGDVQADRLAVQAVGVQCYRAFISALLDITDNVDADGAIIGPEGVVPHDIDDPYLVVAADKGTAALSDEANALAERYGYWLGDAFASGGSVGYDHKAMGITAKGAWESVKRHFGERGLDVAVDPFSVVGIGDMSGDVFGNGMLLSSQIRLVAAFDHRHIFLDPTPDADRAFDERLRLFELPRSSWTDYNTALISAGGGVYPRTAKSIPLSNPVRRVLGIEAGVSHMTPHELISAILRAPVDLLWNGGIGTYIKASDETHLEVGDKGNDALRVDACDVRAKVIGEGGNLGVSARGRIEFAKCGGGINTDALDNSAGVDCSDNEVNIKILLDSLIRSGRLHSGDRDALLKSMTTEVEQLVLDHNIAHNAVLGRCRGRAADNILIHGRQLHSLATSHALNRTLEVLPDDAEVTRRAQQGLGLTSPELATLMAHTKLTLKTDLLASELPDSDVFIDRLAAYFPAQLRERYPEAICNHRLRREIVATILTNEVVDVGGLSYVFRLVEDTGCDSTDAVRAFTVASAIFGIPALMNSIARTAPSTHSADLMLAEVRLLLDRAARWLLSHRPQPLAITAEINRFDSVAKSLVPMVPGWLSGPDAAMVDTRVEELTRLGVATRQAHTISSLLYGFYLLDIVEIADVEHRDATEVAQLYYALSAHLGIDHILTAISALDDADRWDALAKSTLREDIYDAMRSMGRDTVALTSPGKSVTEMIEDWEQANASRLSRARAMLIEIVDRGVYDVKTLAVATRQLRTMVSKVAIDTAALSINPQIAVQSTP
ncbi:MAG: NAD-glutamate dehydrogenase, partial [Comamonadaceae bacterium]